jgi:hypothetical protein
MTDQNWRFVPIVPELAAVDEIGQAFAAELRSDVRVTDATFESHSVAWEGIASIETHDTVINVELRNVAWLLFQVCAFENPGYVSA